MVNFELLVQFLQVYAFQPATAFWRAVEVNVLQQYLPTSGVVLDLGCGDGKLTLILFGNLPKNDLTLIGIDGDADETDQAAHSSFYSRIHTCLASNIPEDSESFDAVISNSVLEHIDDIEKTIAEVSRLLKKGGKFIFTVPAPDFHACLYGALNRRASRQNYLQDMDKRLAHYRYWSLLQWQEILAKYGLHVAAHTEYLTFYEVRRWELISRLTAGILYLLSGRRKTPIQVQKNLGMRQLQNRFMLPRWLAWLLARFLSMGVSSGSEQKYGCLLVEAHKENQP
ncbi:MAG: hypothetical protein OHK0031_04820 [Anaerolineales bacterium]